MAILHIMGFLGADPEERFTNNGKKVWTLRVAERSYKNGQEDTIWWRVTVWGDQYDKFLGLCKKGKPLYVVGEMNKLAIYTDKNNEPQVSYDATARSLHFLPNSETRQENSQQESGYRAPQENSMQNSYGNVQTGYQQQTNYGIPSPGNYVPSHSSDDEPLPF